MRIPVSWQNVGRLRWTAWSGFFERHNSTRKKLEDAAFRSYQAGDPATNNATSASKAARPPLTTSAPTVAAQQAEWTSPLGYCHRVL